MSTLFIVPARGGSKGIPGKNIRPFCGVPLICLAIEGARAVAEADDVICLSTDSEEIRQVAIQHSGLEVPFLRPAELATDKAGSREFMQHALDFYEQRGHKFDKIVLLQPTSPLRRPEDIRGCMDVFTDDVDMAVSVMPAATNPYYNAFETGEDGYLHISKGPGTYTRRQDAPPVWEYNGAVYVIRPASLRAMPMGLFPRRVMYPMDAVRSVDLDTPADWLVAEAIARELKEKPDAISGR